MDTGARLAHVRRAADDPPTNASEMVRLRCADAPSEGQLDVNRMPTHQLRTGEGALRVIVLLSVICWQETA